MKFFKTYSVNFLSLINILFSFAFTMLFALYYKIGSNADSYFYALIIYSNIFLIIQFSYATFFHIYLHIKDEERRNNLYYMLILILVIVSMSIIGMYFLTSSLLPILGDSVKSYLDIYIFTLLFTPLTDISIQLMNAKKKFYFAYFNPIGRNVIALILVLIYQNQASLNFLAYGYLLYDFIFFIFIFQKAVNLLGFQAIFFDKTMFTKITYKSSVAQTGQFFLGLPELLISNLLVNQFPGILSIYTYIKKFVTALIQFIFIPQQTIYASKIVPYIYKYKHVGIILSMKKLWLNTMPYFFASFLVLMILIKYILIMFLSNQIVENYNYEIYFIMFVLFMQNLFFMLDYSYGVIISQKLLFEYTLKIKLIAFSCFILFYLIYIAWFKNIYFLLILSVLPGLILFVSFRKKARMLLKTVNYVL